MTVTWKRATERETPQKPYRAPQDFGSVGEYHEYKLERRPVLPVRANVGYSKLKKGR
jgi:hypothetical protein